MHSNLIVTIIGTDQTGIVGKIINVISKDGLNILDSRLAIFGGEFTFTLLLTGELASISRIETDLPQLGAEFDLLTMMKRTSHHTVKAFPLKFHVACSGIDSAGLLRKVINFFANRNIDIHSLRSFAETNTPEQLPILKSELEIAVTCGMDAQVLKQDFKQLCLELELTGCIEQIATT